MTQCWIAVGSSSTTLAQQRIAFVGIMNLPYYNNNHSFFIENLIMIITNRQNKYNEPGGGGANGIFFVYSNI